jgi:hypothetical protein
VPWRRLARTLRKFGGTFIVAMVFLGKFGDTFAVATMTGMAKREAAARGVFLRNRYGYCVQLPPWHGHVGW